MKTFQLNPNQKKWALTATLVAALGFNLSAPFQGKVQSFEFSSTATTKEFIGANGTKRSVKLEEVEIKGQTHVLAEWSSEAEGRACPSNGECLVTRVLNVEDIGNASAIQEALNMYISESPVDDEDADEIDEEDLKIAKDEEALDKILDDCENKKDYKYSECMVNKFVSTLKSMKAQDKGKRKKDIKNAIDEEMALAFFEEYIKDELLATVTAKNLSELQGTNATQIKGMNLIEKLQAQLPKEYRNIRDAAKDLSVEGFAKYANQYNSEKAQIQAQEAEVNQQLQAAKNLMNQANSTNDPNQKQMFLMQANELNNSALNLQSQTMMAKARMSGKYNVLNNLRVNGFKLPNESGLNQAGSLVDPIDASKMMSSFDAETLKSLNTPVDMLQDMIDQNNQSLNGGGGQQLPQGNNGTIGRGTQRFSAPNGNQFQGGPTLPRSADGGRNGYSF